MTSLLLLKKRLIKEKLDALFVSKPANVSYLSGFSGDESCLLVTSKKDFFITDSRYFEQAKKETKNFQIQIAGEVNHFDLITSLIENNKLKKIGFEAKHITYGEVSKIRDRLKSAEFVPTYDLAEGLRVVKLEAEIGLIKRAVRINLSALELTAKQIKPGRKEKDLAALLEYRMRQEGADKPAFETIVLSGKRSSMPHGKPSDNCIKNNQPVLVDSGACFKGYNSDLTRVFFLGKIHSVIKRVHGIVRAAQDAAIKAIKPGREAKKIDLVARDYIKTKGFGRYFGHSLGHGVGRDVHEAPSISNKSKDILKQGMVFTVEPAIYLPGVGGIRLEEMVLVTSNGCEVLSR